MRSGHRSGRVEPSARNSLELGYYERRKADDSSRSILSGSRLSRRRLLGLADALSARDQAVLAALSALRVMSGGQLERLAFAAVTASARGRIRRRVLARLVELGLVVTLDRRVGGVRAGSAGLVYALSAGGQRLLDLEAGRSTARRRQPSTPGALFLAHALAVAELYVALVERITRVETAELRRFAVEAEARWEVREIGLEAVLRPDALAMLGMGDIEDVWWLEVDRSTESLPRLRTKLLGYLDFAHAGVAGPGGVLPRVLVSVTSAQRAADVRALVRRMPPPAAELFAVALESEAAGLLVREMVTGQVEKPP
jgi:hypothetical protein